MGVQQHTMIIYIIISFEVSNTSTGNCATSEVILIVLLLYLLVPPMGDYTDVITHVNLERINVNLGERINKKILKLNYFCIFPKVGYPSNFPLGKSV